MIVCDPNKAINIGMSLICGGCRLEVLLYIKRSIGSRQSEVPFLVESNQWPTKLVLGTSCSVLQGYGKDWLSQCQDNVTEWEIGSWCWRLGFPIRQHYKVAVSAHRHTSVPSCYDHRCCYDVKHLAYPPLCFCHVALPDVVNLSRYNWCQPTF